MHREKIIVYVLKFRTHAFIKKKKKAMSLRWRMFVICNSKTLNDDERSVRGCVKAAQK